MIGKRVFIALSLALIGLSFQQAQAQTFSSNGNSRRPKPAQAQEDFIDSHSTLQKSFDDFNTSLDSTSNRMRKDYEDSVSANIEKNRLEAMTNKIDTTKISNDSFQNTQKEALDSGGLYNTPANGYGYGGGVFAAPNVRGRYYASVPRTGTFNRGGGGRHR